MRFNAFIRTHSWTDAFYYFVTTVSKRTNNVNRRLNAIYKPLWNGLMYQ